MPQILPSNSYLVRFEAFTAVTMKNVVFWDVVLCRSCVNRRFGGTYRLHLQGRKIRERRTSVARCPKRRLTEDLHSATSQKTTFFNSYLIYIIYRLQCKIPDSIYLTHTYLNRTCGWPSETTALNIFLKPLLKNKNVHIHYRSGDVNASFVFSWRPSAV
jgi:hypothetical protein